MGGAQDLSFFSMAMCLLLLLIPFAVIVRFKLGLAKKLLVSTFRMIVQLVLIGIFLQYLFKLNNGWVNVLWFLFMISVAAYSVINSSKLSLRHFAIPVLCSFIVANLFVVVYFNLFIVRMNTVFDAKYVIAIGGMLLGNSLRADVVGLGDYYQSLKKEENLYLYKLSLGASKYEALLPFAKKSFVAAVNPTLASMATMGIVSLPGMMTGQLLGGSVPLVAIKYQIAIMIAIIASTVLSILLSILTTTRKSVDKYGMLKKEVLK
ncbi:MAG: ABC transporter permease [Paludibacteraceae bacterium]|nr:ABC transporter permease [Paludibacteraceae bacterium]